MVYKMEAMCKKEIFNINLPEDILLEIIAYCVWPRPLRSSWYIVASKFDTSCLTRAKQTDQVLSYLASDDDDCYDVFKRRTPELLDYVHHITNRTV